MPTPLQEFNEDPKYSQNHIFYIDYDFSEAQGKFDVKHLEQISHDDTYPIIYACKDGTSPQHGNSGSPIVKASIIISGSKPVWYFEIIGVLYARCEATWCSEKHEIPLKDLENKKLVCSIPCSEDFKHIRDELIAHDSIQNIQARIIDLKQSGKDDELTEALLTKQLKSLTEEESLKESILKSYTDGMSSLNIQLPIGLEKLRKHSWANAKIMCDTINRFLKDLSLNTTEAKIPERLTYNCDDGHQYQHFIKCRDNKTLFNRQLFQSFQSENFKAFLNSNAFLFSIFVDKYSEDSSVLSDSVTGGLAGSCYGIDFSEYELQLGPDEDYSISEFKGSFCSCHVVPISVTDNTKIQSMTTISAKKLIQKIMDYEIQHQVRRYPLSYSR